LTLNGDRAVLTVDVKTAMNGGLLPQRIGGPWAPVSSQRFVGEASENKGTLGLVFRDEDGGYALSLVCTRSQVSVAAATAVRVRSADADECGDVGTWLPPVTTPMDAWVCHQITTNPDDVAHVLTFGEAPGIEHLFINDDCIIQGGGLRRVPRDGSVGNVRGKQPEAAP
jgi:hypothetical protein